MIEHALLFLAQIAETQHRVFLALFSLHQHLLYMTLRTLPVTF